MRHLKSLICDCLSFTQGLITSVFTTDRYSTFFNIWSTTPGVPSSADV
jgi:hypothetical protein